MSRLLDILKHRYVVAVLGLAVALLAVLLIAGILHLNGTWTWTLLALVAGAWLTWQVVLWLRARRAARRMDGVFEQQAQAAAGAAAPDRRDEIEQLRTRLQQAVRTIKRSRLGQTSSGSPLYELPWYIVIGNPAAGKSSAILNSGLNFPFAEKHDAIVHGIGGTRNCDWFFTTEGILLDTAGRYSVEGEDRREWLGFLDLLKKHRPLAPINGIVIVASVEELARSRPDHTIALAKQLRQRVQELTERLAIFAPVYVMFTKADLIAGFVDFFADSDGTERDRVWGATLPCDTSGKIDAVEVFDDQFDLLLAGLKEMSVARMALTRGQAQSPALLTFPLEFVGIKPHLRSFIATLFEDNPFQFKPIFRGFYFTSALQQGQVTHAAASRIVERFGLSSGEPPRGNVTAHTGFFLRNLFSGVVFPDRELVRRYTSRRTLRLRYAVLYASIAALGLALGLWSWSYVGNREMVTHVRADLDKAVKVQAGRVDLASRLEALEILQDRIEQLQRLQEDTPVALGSGLYQGERIAHKLRAEYFKGLQQLMLEPVTQSLEAFLTEVNAQGERLQSAAPAGLLPVAAAAPAAYQELSPANAEDAYNALKTYLMLASPRHMDPSHLGDQVTRHWRHWLENNRGSMPREKMIRSAEKILSFYLAQARSPDFPVIENRLVLVEQSRETLRKAVKGMAARERVYAEIRMRASTRFPALSVAGIVGDQDKDIIAGSHSVPGALTRDAWEQYVEGAIREAARKEQGSADWVLKTSARDDLTLEGSPERIERELLRLYKEDYVREWQQFVRGIAIPEFPSFEEAARRMDRLGDPARSPLGKLVQTVYRETSWDNPSLMDQGLQRAGGGLTAWFLETILRRAPARVSAAAPTLPKGQPLQTGQVGREFVAIANLVVVRGDGKEDAPLKVYLDHLYRIRSRFNQIRNAGDIGPASRQLLQGTLDGSGSEIADALKHVDEGMLAGTPDGARDTVRPLLVRPLMQAFAVLLEPTERELNRHWAAQVYAPFHRSLAAKYPFSPDSRIEATPAEIAQVFGADGAIAKFVESSLGGLVIRRGDALAPRTWGDMGIRLNPDFAAGLARYVAPPGNASAAAQGGGGNQTTFEIQPIPAPAFTEFTLEIDGQSLRYRNGAQDWARFVWPHAQGVPGARIAAVGLDGRSVEIVSYPGKFGLERLIDTARRKRLSADTHTLTWGDARQAVSVNFRLISSAQVSGSDGTQAQGYRGLQLPQAVAGRL